MKIAINKRLISNNENKINDSIIIFDGKYNNIGNKNIIVKKLYNVKFEYF